MNGSEDATQAKLLRDGAFWAILSTQFLGAFNDNLYKQLVLLICVDRVRLGEPDRQPVALFLFALPFVLFSGLAGFLADRLSKRMIVVSCKILEIAVMLAGLAAFVAGEMVWLLAVLYFMSMHSTLFGPAKYGILPELFRGRDLPLANGLIQMTTFVSIIFGMALAGFAKEWFSDELWKASLVCVGIAVVGTLTSLGTRRTKVADPGACLHASSVFLDPLSRRLLRQDPILLRALLFGSLFWFLGGVILPTVNVYGKLQLEIGDRRTSVMSAWLGVGIALGCALAGRLSGDRPGLRMVRTGAFGMSACLVALAGLGTCGPDLAGVELLSSILLAALGMFGGFYIVPLNVVVQLRPPADQRGRMVGAMNLCNWIFIILSALFYAVAVRILHVTGDSAAVGGSTQRASWIFAALAPVAIACGVLQRGEFLEVRAVNRE